jgi:ketosteroid isomerase-like protein
MIQVDPSAPDAERRVRNLDAIRRAFLGISHADADEMLANYAEDLVLELPYADPPSVIETRDAVREYLQAAFEIFHFRLDLTAVHQGLDPDVLVVEYVSEGDVTTTGKPYRNTYIGVYWFRDGVIWRVREFYNPLPSIESLAP